MFLMTVILLQGVMMEDERDGFTFLGNVTGWASHCSHDMGQPGCDASSTEADPLLAPDFSPLAPCSPALSRVPLTGAYAQRMPLDDFHGVPRQASGPQVAGAVTGAAAAAGGAKKQMPPVPAAFAR